MEVLPSLASAAVESSTIPKASLFIVNFTMPSGFVKQSISCSFVGINVHVTLLPEFFLVQSDVEFLYVLFWYAEQDLLLVQYMTGCS